MRVPLVVPQLAACGLAAPAIAGQDCSAPVQCMTDSDCVGVSDNCTKCTSPFGTFRLCTAPTAPGAHAATASVGGGAAAAPPLWGASFHAAAPLAPGEAEQFAAAFAVGRTDLTWSAVETVRGRYDFDGYDALCAQLAALGVRPWLILDYGNPLYAGGSVAAPDAVAAFVNYSVAAMRRFAGRNIVFELWNEPNNRAGANWVQPAEYAALAKAVVAARAAGGLQDEMLVGPALLMTTGFEGPQALQKVCDAGGLEGFGAVTVHPYAILPGTPEGRRDEYDKVRTILRDCGGPTTLWSGEWGYSTCTTCFEGKIPAPFAKARSPEEQARFLSRMWLSNAAAGVGASVWYVYRDGADGAPADEEANFGVVGHAYLNASVPHMPKPSYVAAAALQAAFGGGAWSVAGAAAGAAGPADLYSAEFRRTADGAAGYALWRGCRGECGAADATLRLPAPAAGGCLAAQGVTGAPLPPVCPGADGVARVTVSHDPVYLLPPAAPPAAAGGG